MRTSKTVVHAFPSTCEEAVTLRDHFATIALAEIIASRPHETAEKKAPGVIPNSRFHDVQT